MALFVFGYPQAQENDAERALRDKFKFCRSTALIIFETVIAVGLTGGSPSKPGVQRVDSQSSPSHRSAPPIVGRGHVTRRVHAESIWSSDLNV